MHHHFAVCYLLLYGGITACSLASREFSGFGVESFASLFRALLNGFRDLLCSHTLQLLIKSSSCVNWLNQLRGVHRPRCRGAHAFVSCTVAGGRSDPPARRVHTLVVNDEPMEVDVRYSNLVYIARGAYGMVCLADDAVSRQCTQQTRPVTGCGLLVSSFGCLLLLLFTGY